MTRPCPHAGCGGKAAPGRRYCALHEARVRAEMVATGYLTPFVPTRHGRAEDSIFADGWSHLGSDRRRRGRMPGAA